jgi:hypothetical protein
MNFIYKIVNIELDNILAIVIMFAKKLNRAIPLSIAALRLLLMMTPIMANVGARKKNMYHHLNGPL